MTGNGPLVRQDVSTEEKVAFFEKAHVFPDSPSRVETVETHFAWIFLSPRFAYKLKKPIRFGLIDFRETEARRAYCELEVTLNRRLAEATYLRVVPLTRTRDGIGIGGKGEPVDWLVEMRRLPEDETLPALGVSSATSAAVRLERVVRKLIGFYACTPRAPWSGAEYVEILSRFAADQACDPAVQLQADVGFAHAEVQHVAERHRELVEQHRGALERRAAAGRIVDAHGDLRAEHVFMTETPQIIDCLEFSVELRWLDAAEEISFLALDCDRLGLHGVGDELIALYRRLANDAVPDPLFALYRSRRALARAVLAARRVAEGGSDADAWRSRAGWYMRAARDSL